MRIRSFMCGSMVALSILGNMGPGPSNSCRADDWNQFRGPRGTGVASELRMTDSIAEANVVWKIDFAPGTSSPVFSQGMLFATTFEDKQRTVHCLDAATGYKVWSQSIDSARQETATSPNTPATCSPVCDDKYVCALFPDAALVVYTIKGLEVWKKDLGPFYSMHGISASPILVDGRLIVALDQLRDPYIVAFDVASGQELWKVERLLGVTGGYSTPTLAEVGGAKLIISAAPGEMVGYDLMTGEKKFSVLGLSNAPVTTPVVSQQFIYYSEPPGEPIPMAALGNADKNGDEVIELEEVKQSVGTYRLVERIDQGFGNGDGKVDLDEWNKGFGSFLNKGGLSCVELKAAGDKIDAQVAWKYTKNTPYIPSALVMDELIYIINDGGIMLCLDRQSGDVIKRERLKGATGQYYASPIGTGQRIVLASLQGKLSLLSTGKDFQLLSTLDLKEPIVATPSINDGRLYVRTKSQLMCFQ